MGDERKEEMEREAERDLRTGVGWRLKKREKRRHERGKRKMRLVSF